MCTSICYAWSILNVVVLIIISPVGVLEVHVKVWEPVMVCRHTKTNKQKKPQTKNPTFSASEVYAEITTLLRLLRKGHSPD